MTIDISLVNLIWRGVAGVCTIIVCILILREQKKTTQFLKEDLEKREFEEEEELPKGEWVKIEDVQDTIRPILKRFYGASGDEIEYIVQEIEQKAFLIK